MSNTKRSPATYAQESPAANRPRRRRMRLGGILALALTAWLVVASLTGDGFAEAQTSSLSVADFDQSGLQVVALASFYSGRGDDPLFGSRFALGRDGFAGRGRRRPERRFEDRAGDGP